MTAPHKTEIVLGGLTAFILAVLEAQHGLRLLFDPILKALGGS